MRFAHAYEDIISVENLLAAWEEFLNGKRKKEDVQEFEHRLMGNILSLHRDLKSGIYKHGGYRAFKISDPKPRDIHKAPVRDRLLHHAVYRKLYPFFDRVFIADSFSCRRRKGTHRAMNRFRSLAYRLLTEIVNSFHSTETGKGLPLGNLTSQLLASVYMNEFDQFAKHKLKARCYIRYADDFVILSHDKHWLESLLPQIADFLDSSLGLALHPDKVYIKTLASGVDFLGWVHFLDHRVLRTTTKRRMLKRIEETEQKKAVVQSYLGLLKHGQTKKLRWRLI